MDINWVQTNEMSKKCDEDRATFNVKVLSAEEEWAKSLNGHSKFEVKVKSWIENAWLTLVQLSPSQWTVSNWQVVWV